MLMAWQKKEIAEKQAVITEEQLFHTELQRPAPLPSIVWQRLMLRLERANPGRGAIGILRAHYCLRAKQGLTPCLTADNAIDTEKAVRDAAAPRPRPAPPHRGTMPPQARRRRTPP